MGSVVAGLLIILLAVVAVLRRFDVRLVLLLAGLALGMVAGASRAAEHTLETGLDNETFLAFSRPPMAIVRSFLVTLTNEQFVVPICCAMGFAHVLRHTGCDLHLVSLLVTPLRKARILLIPGAVLVGFLVNAPVISQSSTVVVVGSVLVPLLRSARVSAVTIGAALLLGCSIGGELLNPGAPEFRTITKAAGIEAETLGARVLPLLLVHTGIATMVFWGLSARAEVKPSEVDESKPPEAKEPAPFRVNLFKAAVPLVPLAILVLTSRNLHIIKIPEEWLVAPDNAANASFDSRLIGAAMLVGVVAAALTAGRGALATAEAFFLGAGYALTRIISVIVAATCFAEGVKAVGLADWIGHVITGQPLLLMPTASGLPLAFAWVCGSGMASTQSLYGFFVEPARSLGIDLAHIGAVVSISAAAGRTMSPVAAVTLMSAELTESNPLHLIRRVTVPLLIGIIVLVVVATWMVSSSIR